MTTDYAVMRSPVGRLLIETNGRAVTRIALTEREARETSDPVICACVSQLQAYFAGELTTFSVPVEPEGTAFQGKVWQALQSIPYGKTASYAEVAARIGNPKASRAVGQANHVNPLLIVIPCHRVICSDGSIGGYGGGLAVKQYLLALEKRRMTDKTHDV